MGLAGKTTMPKWLVVGLLAARLDTLRAITVNTATIAQPTAPCQECEWPDDVTVSKVTETITFTVNTGTASTFAASSTAATGMNKAFCSRAGSFDGSYCICTLTSSGTTVTAACSLVAPSDDSAMKSKTAKNVGDTLALVTAASWKTKIQDEVLASTGTTYVITVTGQGTITAQTVTAQPSQYTCKTGGCLFKSYGAEGSYWKWSSKTALLTESACKRRCMKDKACTGVEITADKSCAFWYFRACEIGRDPFYWQDSTYGEKTCSKKSSYLPVVSHAVDRSASALLSAVILLASSIAM